MLYKTRTKWFDLGMALKIDFDTLSSIEGRYTEDSDCLRKMLAHRIQSGGPLTLRVLCGCLRSETVGRNDVAIEIEQGKLLPCYIVL